MTRLIDHTTATACHPWPDDVYLQGGEHGVVMRPDSAGGPYTTAFVEIFPPGTFLRGEGPTIEAAEDACWKKYLTWRDCDGTGEPHGPFEARGYANGCGHCTRCGTWMTGVLPVQPADPDREPGPLENALLGTVARADELPDGPRGDAA
jgi:hypothetical protein